MLHHLSKAVKGLVRTINRPAVRLDSPGLPDWGAIIANESALWTRSIRAASSGPRILLPTMIGGHPQFTVVESAIAVALTLRGVKVDIVLCDQQLPGCLRAKVAALAPVDLANYGIKDVFCDHCVNTGRQVFEGTGLEIVRLGDYLDREDSAASRSVTDNTNVAALKQLEINGIPVGEHALAGALRYYGRGDISTEPEGNVVSKRYLEAGILTLRATERLLSSKCYSTAVINHGIYVPHGVMAAVARKAGVRVATWNLAYRRQCAIFSHGDTYHHTLMDEPATTWENMAWSKAHEISILEYLDTRQKGSRDWIWFNNNPDDDVDRFARECGLDWTRPVIGMLTNVVWDAQLHYPANAFPDMVAWVIKTVAYFRDRPDLQLLIRVHPGELAPPGGQTKSLQPIIGEIRKAFTEIPRNVFIIPPESQVSTYSTMKRCNAVIIYGTKAGTEFTSMGIPVIVAGEAWIRNKGVTLDAKNESDYFQLLGQLPLLHRMDPETIERARKYAYHFFFRRMVPLPFLTPVEKAWPPFIVSIDRLSDLLPGNFPGLDVICDGIVKGTPFIYPAEIVGPHDQ